MPKNYIVLKVEGGYQLFTQDKKTEDPKAVNKHVYFHPTSAYAAMGRIVHTENIKALKLDADPAKAPKKEETK